MCIRKRRYEKDSVNEVCNHANFEVVCCSSCGKLGENYFGKGLSPGEFL